MVSNYTDDTHMLIVQINNKVMNIIALITNNVKLDMVLIY